MRTLLTGWTLPRILYLILGISVIAESIAEKQWAGILVGMYMASMGIFNIGCASGTCYNESCAVPPQELKKVELKEERKIIE